MTEKSITGYIYHRQLVSSQELKTIINSLSNFQSYYFLRYSHQVSGICTELPRDNQEIEGQMFNAIFELRWKKFKSGYEILLLSKQEFKLEGFNPLAGKWEICDWNAYWNQEEPKFPKEFTFNGVKNANDIPINQRYFRNSTTATVHFIALTVKEK